MKDPFGKKFSVGDIVLYVRYDHHGPIFAIAEISELSDQIITTLTNETRGILKAKVIKSSSEKLAIDYVFSAYNKNVLLLKSKEIS